MIWGTGEMLDLVSIDFAARPEQGSHPYKATGTGDALEPDCGQIGISRAGGANQSAALRLAGNAGYAAVTSISSASTVPDCVPRGIELVEFPGESRDCSNPVGSFIHRTPERQCERAPAKPGLFRSAGGCGRGLHRSADAEPGELGPVIRQEPCGASPYPHP